MAVNTIPSPTDAPSAAHRDRQLATGSHRRWLRWAVGVAILLVGSTALWVAGLPADSPIDTTAHLTHRIARADLVVTVVEEGILESAENLEIKSQVRGWNTVIWVIDSGAIVAEGDELLRLDSRLIEEQIDERTKYAHWSRSAAEHSAARVAAARLAVTEYEEGRYVADLKRMEKDLVVAQSTLWNAESLLSHARVMAQSGYISQLEVEEKEFIVAQARLDVELKQTAINVLNRFTHAERLQALKGDLAAAEARHQANVERAEADASRRDRALEELKHCLVRAEQAGLVIHPNAAKWKVAPIAQGATVHKDQILLLMPNLAEMQVKVGIDESVVDQVKEGQPATVKLSNGVLEGTVSSVATVTRPAGWWTGNQVKYDTLIALPNTEGLMPGMSAQVEVLITECKDVLAIPVAAVATIGDQHVCWLKTDDGIQRRFLTLGDSNGVFSVVTAGLEEDDEVLLNTTAFVDSLGNPSRQPAPTKEGKTETQELPTP